MTNEEKYIRSQSRAAKPITNNDMICESCMFNIPELPPAHCNMYRPNESYKPNSVLLGGSCPSYRRRVNV